MNFKLFKTIAAENILLTDLPFMSELNMEAFVIENPEVLTTDEYSEVTILINQLPIKSGRKSKGSDGRIDLLASINDQYIAVIELKNAVLRLEHIKQLEDYLEELSSHKEKYLSELQQQYEIKGQEFIGIIIGTDIMPEIKDVLEHGFFHNETIPIIGMTINRYSSEDSREVYILAETYAPPNSEFKWLKFDSWDEFAANQKAERGRQDQVLKLAKFIHDKVIERFGLSSGNVTYAKTAFTFNIAEKKKRTVFAYCGVKMGSVRISMNSEKGIPNKGIWKPKPNSLYSYSVDISSESDVTEELFAAIDDSRKHLLQ